jgi:hypothetical protein
VSSNFDSSTPLAYTGLNLITNPPTVAVNRKPTPNDWQSFNPGDLWRDASVNPTVTYLLRSVNGNIADWEPISGYLTAVSLLADVGGSISGATLGISGGVSGLQTYVSASTTISIQGILSVPNGGTGQSSLNQYSALVGNGTNPITASALLSVNDLDTQVIETASRSGHLVDLQIQNTNTDPNSAVRTLLSTDGSDAFTIFDDASVAYWLGIQSATESLVIYNNGLRPLPYINGTQLFTLSQSGVPGFPQAGTPGVGKVLTSDIAGNATWQSILPISVNQYDVLVGGPGNTISSVGPGVAGYVFLSGGNAANPTYSTLASTQETGTNGTFVVSKNLIGNQVGIIAVNTDATNTSSKSIITAVTYPGGGDPYFATTIEGGIDWAFGVNHTNFHFCLGHGGPPSALVGGPILDIDTSGNITLQASDLVILSLNNATQDTVGVAGGASNIPASPTHYLKINVNGNPYVIPLFAAS